MRNGGDRIGASELFQYLNEMISIYEFALFTVDSTKKRHRNKINFNAAIIITIARHASPAKPTSKFAWKLQVYCEESKRLN